MGLYKYAWKFLIVILFPLLSFGQQEFFNLLPREQQIVVSNLKNPRFVDTMNLYEAFGFVERTGVDRVTDFTRIGTGHLTGGNIYKRDYIISQDKWGDTVCIDRDTVDARDAWGGRMDNDSLIIFFGRSHNGVGGSPWDMDLYILRGDLDGHFAPRIPFSFGSYPHLQRSYFFGHTAHSKTPGEYWIQFYELNVDTGNLSRRILAAIHTTDYFRSYEFQTIFDGTSFPASEGTLAWFGTNKMNMITRLEQGGDLMVFESSNSGATWTYRNRSNLYWYINTDVIPYTFMDTTSGHFYFVTQNRDNDFIEVSSDNDTTIFGSDFPEYNGPELFFYNQSEDHAAANSSLGYPSMINIVGDSIFLVVWTHETTASRANNMWTRTNLITDPSGTIPIAPPTITSSFVNTTLFRIDISGYTQEQLNNVRYFMFDMSTDPGFGSFVTAQYRNTSVFPSSVLQNIYMNSLWDVFHSLATGTTYYIRIKACNNNGCSTYTTINVTTL